MRVRARRGYRAVNRRLVSEHYRCDGKHEEHVRRAHDDGRVRKQAAQCNTLDGCLWPIGGLNHEREARARPSIGARGEKPPPQAGIQLRTPPHSDRPGDARGRTRTQARTRTHRDDRLKPRRGRIARRTTHSLRRTPRAKELYTPPLDGPVAVGREMSTGHGTRSCEGCTLYNTGTPTGGAGCCALRTPHRPPRPDRVAH